MTPASQIPVLRVRGSHRDVGEHVGLACGPSLRAGIDRARAEVPDGRSWDEQLALADRYREVTRAAYPWYLRRRTRSRRRRNRPPSPTRPPRRRPRRPS